MIMHRIYAQAKNVLVWMGGINEGAGRALAHMINFANWQVAGGDMKHLRQGRITDKAVYEKMGIPQISFDDWVEIYKFWNRSWFKRAWVAQEVALANQLVFLCGMLMLRSTPLFLCLLHMGPPGWIQQIRVLVEPLIRGKRHATQIHRDSTRPNPTQRTLYQASAPNRSFDPKLFINMRHESWGFGIREYGLKSREGARASPLLKLLHGFRALEATDPRDKIYAFTGLSRELVEENRAIVPQYDQPVEDVYLGAASFMAQSPWGLNILSLKEQDTAFKLPSWVPDFSVDSGESFVVGDYNQRFAASLGLDPQSCRINGPILKVRGILCGKIQRIERFEPQRLYQVTQLLEALPEVSNIWQPPTQVLERLYDEIPPQGIQPNEGGRKLCFQSRFEVLWRTVLFDSMSGQQPAPAETKKAAVTYLEHAINSFWTLSLWKLLKDEKDECSNAEIWKILGEAPPLDFDIDGSFDHEYTTAAKRMKEAYTAMQILTGQMEYGTDVLCSPPGYDTLEQTIQEFGFFSEKSAAEIVKLNEQFSLSNPNTSELFHSFSRNIELNCFSKRNLFTTDSGRLGLAAKSIKAGDEVWVLAGASVPFVIRPVQAGEYRLVTEAYLHGIMYGEAVVDSGGSVETIHLV
ncbi:hypothetical protein GQ53DRAFT_90789 [Thozetella sp. PMI_491]|nr:hypothetical protein GQ53DRAFT_90789 [Thozetella sp. PMI_491]